MGDAVTIAMTAIGPPRDVRRNFSAGQRFASVVDTEGRDVEHEMAAIRKLGQAFTIMLVILGIAFAIMACALIGIAVLLVATLASR